MQAYLFDSFERFKRYSNSLDAKTAICNKTWVVFNDSGERELYIFKEDGEVFITRNGVGNVARWEWVAANKSIVIREDCAIMMLHPQYIDEVVLSLKLDGTDNYVFLIEESNRLSFLPRSLHELENYFVEKKQKIDEQEKRVVPAPLQATTPSPPPAPPKPLSSLEIRRLGEEIINKGFYSELFEYWGLAIGAAVVPSSFILFILSCLIIHPALSFLPLDVRKFLIFTITAIPVLIGIYYALFIAPLSVKLYTIEEYLKMNPKGVIADYVREQAEQIREDIKIRKQLFFKHK